MTAVGLNLMRHGPALMSHFLALVFGFEGFMFWVLGYCRGPKSSSGSLTIVLCRGSLLFLFGVHMGSTLALSCLARCARASAFP